MESTHDYDYIIVGSGFGGSVAGLRLRQRGHRVLMLEKGRRWGTNDFPRSTWDLRNFLWNPAARLQGLLRIDFLRHAAVLSGVGVGGGSIAYGNTLFRPLDSFYRHPRIASLGGREMLAPY